jgi:hypothetical protein
LDPLETIRGALDGISQGLALAEEEPTSAFDPGLLGEAAALEDGVCRDFSLALAKRAVSLRLALKALVREPAPETLAFVLRELDQLTRGLEPELARRQDGRAWLLARQLNDIARHMVKPNSAENPGFRRLPEMLEACDWVRGEVSRAQELAALALPADLHGRLFRRHAVRRWFERESQTPAGALFMRLEAIRNDIEFRARQIWFMRKAGPEEPQLPSIYVWAHDDLFPTLRHGLSAEVLGADVARLRALTLEYNLPDIALCLEAPEWLAQYAMNYLMPPAPDEWAVEQGAELERVLDGRLSRWYFYAFAHRLDPLEMTASVLRIGRPLFYERRVAHALLEYSLLQGFSLTVPSAAVYLEAIASLEREFLVLFDGYLMRHAHYPSLRTPEGWRDYLEALTALHYRGGSSPRLAEFREAFLKQRALRSPIELLYRTTSGHGSIQ